MFIIGPIILVESVWPKATWKRLGFPLLIHIYSYPPIKL